MVEALEYAAEENIIMDFIFYNDRINDLLKEVFKIQATTVNNIPNQLIEKLKRAIERRGQNKKNSNRIQFKLS